MAEPRVRFKRDDGSSYPDIQQVPFGDVVKPFTEKTKTENEDVLLSCAINGVFLNTELFGHQRGASNKGYKKIRRNTLILSAQNLHLGNANVNQRFDHGIISPAYNTYDIVGCNPDYMAQWVKRDATKKFFYDATTTGASQCRRNVDWDALYEQIFYVPCEEEQQKIADFLSSVDEVISTTEEEVANLETQKKAVMKKIFSQEVRFKKADGSDFPKWEERALNEEAEYLSGLTYSPDNVVTDESNGILVLRSSNIKGGMIDYQDKVFVDCKVSDDLVVKENDILMCVRNGSKKLVGKTALIKKSDVGHTWGAFMMIIRSHTDNRFVYHYMNSDSFYKQMFPDVNTATIAQITKSMLNDCKIEIPCPDEQRLIADFLSDFDEAIVSAKKELELWKELKKGLLQQMFV